MARDDYFVIVYQILAYLYKSLKSGNDIDPEMLKYDSKLIKAGNEKYWNYIIWNLYKSGFIEGIVFVTIDGVDTPIPQQLEKCQITPSGIEYLSENSLMKKAFEALKTAKEITPGV